MNKKKVTVLILLVIAGGIAVAKAQSISSNDSDNSFSQRGRKILYFNPEVYPQLEEIQEPTNSAFFSAVSDETSELRTRKMLRADSPMEFDSVDQNTIREYCRNNDADYAIVPKVKYFKVGLGKYVFSNQVVVSMKLYDAEGNFITETQYDTYRKNMRLLGSAENSVKIGTRGAFKNILKNIRKLKRDQPEISVSL